MKRNWSALGSAMMTFQVMTTIKKLLDGGGGARQLSSFVCLSPRTNFRAAATGKIERSVVRGVSSWRRRPRRAAAKQTLDTLRPLIIIISHNDNNWPFCFPGWQLIYHQSLCFSPLLGPHDGYDDDDDDAGDDSGRLLAAQTERSISPA